MAKDTIPIVKGIRMTSEGEVTVDPDVDDALFDLAIALQAPDDTPVDVEHIVAALILASRNGQVPPDYELRERDKPLQAILRPHVRMIFQKYGGQVAEEE
jgi:hypothetical protein